jgi:hypothetical protein
LMSSELFLVYFDSQIIDNSMWLVDLHNMHGLKTLAVMEKS